MLGDKTNEHFFTSGRRKWEKVIAMKFESLKCPDPQMDFKWSSKQTTRKCCRPIRNLVPYPFSVFATFLIHISHFTTLTLNGLSVSSNPPGNLRMSFETADSSVVFRTRTPDFETLLIRMLPMSSIFSLKPCEKKKKKDN